MESRRNRLWMWTWAAFAGAALIGIDGAQAGQASPTPTPTSTVQHNGHATPTKTPTPPGSIRVRVGRNEFTCEGARAGVTVVLEPRGDEALTDDEGFATFTGLDAGDYRLRLDPPCGTGGTCWDDLPVSVGDVAVEVEHCPPACGEQIFLNPTSGLPGAEVMVEGACQWIHSGATSDLFLGPIRVGTVRGETAGDFRQTFTVPRIPAGLYTVQAAGGAAAFRVLGTEPVCPGDCDGDLQVAVAELVRSVGIALQTIAAPTCPVFASGASIADLVRAVRAALDGCAALELEAPTPGPEAGLCEFCCNHCDSSACAEECFRRDGCLLAARMFGWVRDAMNRAPIAGATVTFNGVSVASSTDGSYDVYAQRPESCALDYLFEIEVSADGYLTQYNQFYRVPISREGWEHTILLAPSSPASSFEGDLPGVVPVQVGRLH